MPANHFSHQDYYRQHSRTSELNALSKLENSLLTQCPNEADAIFDCVQNWVIHEQECQWGRYEFAKDRYGEAEIRNAKLMLYTLLERLNDKPYSAQRADAKLICNCRGASLLFTALLRQQGIPARLRVGFVSYHPIAKFNMDHVIVEFWDEAKQCLRWADPLVNDAFKKNAPQLVTLNATDIQEGEFIPAEVAWLAVRQAPETANDYGVGLFKSRRGLFTIRNRLLQEMAARLKMEMQPGDLWGYMLLEGPSVDPTDPSQLSCLDQLAELLIADDLPGIQALYHKTPALKIPSIIINHSAMNGVKAVELMDIGEATCALA